MEGRVVGTEGAKGGRRWCCPHPHTFEAPDEDKALKGSLRTWGASYSDHPSPPRGAVGILPCTVECPEAVPGAQRGGGWGVRQPTSPSCWPGSLSQGQDVKECRGWASRSSVLGMRPRSSPAPSRSSRRCVAFIYWCHHAFALPCPSEPAQGVGVAALEAALGIVFFFLLFASGYLTPWHKRPITVSSPQRLILTQLGTTKSRGPQLNFQADT